MNTTSHLDDHRPQPFDAAGPRKYLFATTPLPGHVNPGLPIARALVERGHEVRWYTGKAHARAVTATGAVVEPMVDAYDPAVQSLDERYPERARLEGLRGLKYDLKHLFLDEAPAYVHELERVLDRFPADVVVVDTAFLAGRLLHERGGPPYASYGISILPLPGRDVPPPGTGKTPATSAVGRLGQRLLTAAAPRLLFGDVQRYQQQIRHQLGLPPTRLTVIEQFVSPFLYVQGSTSSFEYPRRDLPPQVHFVGPLLPPSSRAAEAEPWLAALGTERPLVLVNQGTVATDPADLVLPALEAFAHDDVDVVTTGVAPEAVRQPIPTNVHVRAFVPFADLLPRVSVAVTNGGFGSVQAALAHGIPLVVAGMSEDKRDIAARVAWSGAGIRLPVRSPSPEVLREAVHDVLDRPSYGQRAEAFRREIDATDAPRQAADLVERLAATGRPVATPASPERDIRAPVRP